MKWVTAMPSSKVHSTVFAKNIADFCVLKMSKHFLISLLESSTAEKQHVGNAATYYPTSGDDILLIPWETLAKRGRAHGGSDDLQAV